MTNKKSLLIDASLLSFILLIFLTFVFVAVSPNAFFFDLICMIVTLLLVIVTYFTNIVTGLIFNLLFFFGQIVYILYQFLYQDSFQLSAIYWLIIPPILCLLIYLVTLYIREIVTANIELQKTNSRLNALDQDTHLRTLTMLDSDYQVVEAIAQRNKLSFHLSVMRIRHWDSLKPLLSPDQIKELIQVISDLLQESYGNDNFKYLIDQAIPTWGVLSTTTNSELRVIRGLMKEKFQEELNKSNYLRDLTVELIISITAYSAEDIHSSTDLLAAGIRELQYDV